MVDESALKNIEKLHEMKGAGILSQAEFEEAKRKLLSGAEPTSARSVAKAVPLERPRDDDYVAWVLMPLRRYPEFTGRSSRKEFWLFFGALTAVAFCLLAIWIDDTDYDGTGAVGVFAVLTLAICLLGTLVPYIALQVRRFHDQGRSGFFALLNLIPYVGGLIVLAFMLVEGTKGENEYGSDPLA